MALTDLAARKLNATDKRQEIAQGDIPGLALVINPPRTKHPTGAKTWVLRYRVGGKSVKYTIGALSKFTVGKAKEVAKKLLVQVAIGEDPPAEDYGQEGQAAPARSRFVREAAAATPGAAAANPHVAYGGGGCALEGGGDGVIDNREPHELHRLARRFRHVLEILLIALGQKHGGDAGAHGGEHLVLDATDRQDQAAQRNLPCHGNVALHRAAGEQRHDGDEHGDASARAVLRDGASRHVQVYVRLLERCFIDAERGASRLHQA